MTLTAPQNERLHFTVKNLRRTAEFGFIRQLLIAESAKNEPDMQGLKAHILDVLGLHLQYEIEGIVKMRVEEIARP